MVRLSSEFKKRQKEARVAKEREEKKVNMAFREEYWASYLEEVTGIEMIKAKPVFMGWLKVITGIRLRNGIVHLTIKGLACSA